MSSRKKKSLYLGDSGEIIYPPAYPRMGYEILREFRHALGSGQRIPTLRALATKLGIGLSTCHNWFCVGGLEPIQVLLCMMEQMPEEQWLSIMRSFLRDFPNLKHPRLAHNPEGLTQLEQALKEPTGLTLIRGRFGYHSDIHDHCIGALLCVGRSAEAKGGRFRRA